MPTPLPSRTHWLRGRCLSYGQGVAGRVVAEMVRSLLRVTETDDDATVAAALDERLARHVTDEIEREVLRPRLASLLGLSDAVFDQADLFACWRAFFESLCARRVRHASSSKTCSGPTTDSSTSSTICSMSAGRRSWCSPWPDPRSRLGVPASAPAGGRPPSSLSRWPTRDGRLLDGLVADLPAQPAHRTRGPAPRCAALRGRDHSRAHRP